MERRNLRETNIHFLYIVIIAGIVIIGLLTALFFPSKDAQKFLSFAGVALSLVLSVIAILITLWDVAGQRQQVADITESAKNLRELVEEQKENYENLNNVVEEVLEGVIEASFTKQLEEMRSINEKNIETLTSGFSNTINEIQKSIDNLELQKEQKENAKNNIKEIIERNNPSSLDGISGKKNFASIYETPKIDGTNLVRFDKPIKEFVLKRKLTENEKSDLESMINHDSNLKLEYLNKNGIYKIILKQGIFSVAILKYFTQKVIDNIERYLEDKGILDN